ncbi:MAG: HAD family phosphatase [Treponema sp.]|nr:HAD family phosphatase [Treponema sp.]
MLYIFDMGGVVTNDADGSRVIGDMLGLGREEFRRVCMEDKDGRGDLLMKVSDGKISVKEFWDIFEERSGIHARTDWWHVLFHPRLNEGTAAIIKRLRAQGKRVVCGTNTMESHYANHVERGDYALFDQTYASFQMGVSKPDTEFWKIILVSEGIEAKDAVFIDDRRENCEAAASLGIRAIHFTSAEALEKELENL